MCLGILAISKVTLYHSFSQTFPGQKENYKKALGSCRTITESTVPLASLSDLPRYPYEHVTLPERVIVVVIVIVVVVISHSNSNSNGNSNCNSNSNSSNTTVTIIITTIISVIIAIVKVIIIIQLFHRSGDQPILG